MFEEEYRRLAQHPDYQSLFTEVDLAAAAEEVYDGYFSIDRKGGWTDTAENTQANRDKAECACNLIMGDKERLLSLDEPPKFIFSHSALRDIQTERERRQTIGRAASLRQSGRTVLARL